MRRRVPNGFIQFMGILCQVTFMFVVLVVANLMMFLHIDI